MSDLILRPITGRDELELFNRLPYVLNDELADDLAAGRRRPEWMWVALRGDRLVARVAWWGRDTPFLMDVFDAEDVNTGVHLLREAMSSVISTSPPKYLRNVPPGWRETGEVDDLMAALSQVGARPFVERLRFEWRPGTPVPVPSGRLTFRPIDSTDEILDLMTRVLDGTLDAHSLDDLTRMPAREAAVHHFEDELAQYRSPRGWWRVAVRDGEPVGFVTPARNDYGPVIGYLAVLPSHRGNGYIHDILAEGTRILAAEDAPRIRAATDVGNAPMADAFLRAGYVNFERTVMMTWT